MNGVETKLGQSLDDLIKSQKTAAKKTAVAAKKKKATPSKGVKPAPKSKPKAGKKAAASTPKGKKGISIAVKKTPVSVKGGVKKSKSKATPMAIDSKVATGGKRARRVTSGGKTKVVLVGGNSRNAAVKSGAASGAGGHNKRVHVKGETGGSINGRFEKISRERASGSRRATGKGTTNKFGVYMPF